MTGHGTCGCRARFEVKDGHEKKLKLREVVEEARSDVQIKCGWGMSPSVVLEDTLKRPTLTPLLNKCH